MKMVFVRKFILNIQIWSHRICGFRTFNYNGKFEKDKSIAKYYPLLVLLCFVGNCVMRSIEMSRRIKYFGTNTFRKTVITQGFVLTFSSMITICSESFIFINEKEKIYNNFKRIHTILYVRDFNKLFIFERSTITFSMFLVFIFGQNYLYRNTKIAKITDIVQLITSIQYLVIASGIIEISSNIRVCKDYVSALNDCILFYAFKKKECRKNELDFRPTTLRTKVSRMQDMFFTYKQSSQIKDYTQVVAMINENMKLISRRYTGIVRMF